MPDALSSDALFSLVFTLARGTRLAEDSARTIDGETVVDWSAVSRQTLWDLEAWTEDRYA